MCPGDRTTSVSRPPSPPHRRLRVYAFDPGVSQDVDAEFINQITLQVPWEGKIPPDPAGEALGREPRELMAGPVGEYLEVVDVDPASGRWYAPVDLNDAILLAQDGHAPSESNPQFHQQMVYAVAMKTIEHFEQSLGRRTIWRDFDRTAPSGERDRWVPRLRIYPHALREANAYYSPEKISLLFGYFPAGQAGSANAASDVGRNLPGGTVFTCLSHDVIAHETTHALLDGLHRRYMEPSNPDVLAFHEAFADLVALFQHFTFPEAVRHQIARTRGDLSAYNMLGQLARQFGEATGHRGALRDAIGRVDPRTGQWAPHPPDPCEYMEIDEPHRRGALLVAAVFDAFVQIYRRRTADLYRIASGGTGVLPQGELHPDLVDRLAREATKSARHLLRICIRALDYCPPVDPTFGEYLRAMITADYDMVADDRFGYRLALIDAFRRRGIYPPEVDSLSVDSLLWKPPSGRLAGSIFRSMTEERQMPHRSDESHFKDLLSETSLSWDIRSDRYRSWKQALENRKRLHAWLTQYLLPGELCDDFAEELGLHLSSSKFKSITRDDKHGGPKVEVHAARPAWRVRENGSLGLDLVVEFTQKRLGYFDEERQQRVDDGTEEPANKDFWFRGGCTLLIDAGSGEIRFSIRKDIRSQRRLRRQREYERSPSSRSLAGTYFHKSAKGEFAGEPFAMLHAEYE